MVKRIFYSGCGILLLMLSGCYYLQSVDAPMASLYYHYSDGYRAPSASPQKIQKDLLIMLPGIGDGITRFEREGLIAQLAETGLPVDVVVVNAHIGYYRSRTFMQRLQHDVVRPALQAGYEKIHLAGLSLGGFGSLLYWRHQLMTQSPDFPLVSALLLTPYLGEPEHYAHRLTSEPKPVSDENSLWPWLERLSQAQRQHWYIGIAEQDEFYPVNLSFAGLLPEDQVFISPGGHDWDTWRELWPQLLVQWQSDFFDR